jgi:hypothetical protein
MTIQKALALLLVPLSLAGCTTIQVSNLTPTTVPRNPENLYAFEVALNSNQQTLRFDTVQPYVQIGLEMYPMQRTPLMSNRWETLVPIPPDREFLQYRYKFDYQYAAIPERRQGSKLSQPYQLEVAPR